MSGENPNSSPRYCPTPTHQVIPGSASPPPQMQIHHMQSQSMGSYYSYHNSQSGGTPNYYAPAQSSPNPGYYGAMNPHQQPAAQPQYVQQQQAPQWSQQQHVHQNAGYYGHSYVPPPQQNYAPHSPQHSPHTHPQQQQQQQQISAVTGSSSANSVMGQYDINLTHNLGSPSNHSLTQNHQQHVVSSNSDSGGQSSIMNLARFVNQNQNNNNTTANQSQNTAVSTTPMQQNLSVNNNNNIIMSGESVSPRIEPRSPPVAVSAPLPHSIPALPTSTVLLSSSSISSSAPVATAAAVTTSVVPSPPVPSTPLVTHENGGGGQTGGMMPVRLQNMAKGARTKASMRKLLLEQQNTEGSKRKQRNRKPTALTSTTTTPPDMSPSSPPPPSSPTPPPLPSVPSEPRKVEQEIAFVLLDLKTGKNSPEKEKEKGKSSKDDGSVLQSEDDSVTKSDTLTTKTKEPGKNRRRKPSNKSLDNNSDTPPVEPKVTAIPPSLSSSSTGATTARGSKKGKKQNSLPNSVTKSEDATPKSETKETPPHPPPQTPTKSRKRKLPLNSPGNVQLTPTQSPPKETASPRGRASKAKKLKSESNVIKSAGEEQVVVPSPEIPAKRKRKSPNKALDIDTPMEIDSPKETTPLRGRAAKKGKNSKALPDSVKKTQDVVPHPPQPLQPELQVTPPQTQVKNRNRRKTPPFTSSSPKSVLVHTPKRSVPPMEPPQTAATSPPKRRASKKEKKLKSLRDSIESKLEIVVPTPTQTPAKSRKGKSPVKPLDTDISPQVAAKETTPSRGRAKKGEIRKSHLDAVSTEEQVAPAQQQLVLESSTEGAPSSSSAQQERSDNVVTPQMPVKNRKRKSPSKQSPSKPLDIEIPAQVEPKETPPPRAKTKKAETPKSFPSPDIASNPNGRVLPTKESPKESSTSGGESMKKRLSRSAREDTDRKENETIMEVSLAYDKPLPPLSHYLQFEYSQRNNYPPSIPSSQKRKTLKNETDDATMGESPVKTSTSPLPPPSLTPSMSSSKVRKDSSSSRSTTLEAHKNDKMVIETDGPVKTFTPPVPPSASSKNRKDSHRLLEARKNELMAEIDQLNISFTATTSTTTPTIVTPTPPSLLPQPKNRKDSHRLLEARKNELMAEIDRFNVSSSTVVATTIITSTPPHPKNRKNSNHVLEVRQNEMGPVKVSSSSSSKNRKESHRLLEARKNELMAEINQLSGSTENKPFGQWSESKSTPAAKKSRKNSSSSPAMARAATADDVNPLSTLQFIPALAKPLKTPSVFVKSVPLAATPTNYKQLSQNSSTADDDVSGGKGKKQQGKKNKKGDAASTENKGKGQKKVMRAEPNLRVKNGTITFYRGSEEEDVEVPLSKLRLERPSEAFDRSVPWVCTFCRLGPHAGRLGDLFGPYYVKKLPTTSTTTCANVSVADLCQPQKETWMHQDCALWAGGVMLIGVTVRGLDQAVQSANLTTCTICHEKGATIGCLSRKCSQAAHFPCAQKSLWKLSNETFHSYCQQHS